MTAQVIFLNRFYWPNQEEQARLDFLQESFRLYQAELAMMERGFTPYQRFIFRETSHNKIRASWYLVTTKTETFE